MGLVHGNQFASVVKKFSGKGTQARLQNKKH